MDVKKISDQFGKCIPIDCTICLNGHDTPEALGIMLIHFKDAKVDPGTMLSHCYICRRRLLNAEGLFADHKINKKSLYDVFNYLVDFYRRTGLREIYINYVRTRRRGKPFSIDPRNDDYKFGNLDQPLYYFSKFYDELLKYRLDYRYDCPIPTYPENFFHNTYCAALEEVIQDMVNDGVLDDNSLEYYYSMKE